MPAAIKISEDEMAALAGLPHLSIVIYLLGIRPRMDFRNGTVGERPLISWQALRESAYVEPHQGVKHDYASVNAVRRAVGWLEKAGLVAMRSRERQLVFFLPFAHADLSVRKKADKGPADQAGKGPADQTAMKSTLCAGVQEESRQAESRKADKHPVSGKPLKPSPPPPTTSTTATSMDGGRAGREEIWIYPRGFTKAQKAVVADMMRDVGEGIGQDILDELDAGIAAGSVRNLRSLLAHFIGQANAGDFMPDKGVAVRRRREAEARTRLIEAEQLRKANQDAAKVVSLHGNQPRSAKEVLVKAQRQRAAGELQGRDNRMVTA